MDPETWMEVLGMTPRELESVADELERDALTLRALIWLAESQTGQPDPPPG